MPKKSTKKITKFIRPKEGKTKIYKKAPVTPKIDPIQVQKDIVQIEKGFFYIRRRVRNFIEKYKIVFAVQFTFLLCIIALVIGLIYFAQGLERTQLKNIKSDFLANPYPGIGHGPDLFASASAFAVYEKDSRVVVIAKNENFRFAPASTAKIMTALVALEQYPFKKVLKAHEPLKVEGSKMGLFDEEEMTVENLLYGLLLPSGNDAAYVLASGYPGGVQGFVNRMNQKAKELKLANTFFADPSGYSDDNYSTARDMVHLAAEAYKNQIFRSIVKTKSKTVKNYSGTITHKLSNLNKLLDKKGVMGIKTGFTEEAGGVLVTAYEYKGKTYFITVMQSEDRFADSEELLDKVVKNIQLLAY